MKRLYRIQLSSRVRLSCAFNEHPLLVPANMARCRKYGYMFIPYVIACYIYTDVFIDPYNAEQIVCVYIYIYMLGFFLNLFISYTHLVPGLINSIFFITTIRDLVCAWFVSTDNRKCDQQWAAYRRRVLKYRSCLFFFRCCQDSNYADAWPTWHSASWTTGNDHNDAVNEYFRAVVTE